VSSPALVAVPGLVCDADVFAPQVEALAGDVDVGVPSLDDADSIDLMAEAVLATAPPAFALLGFSMGGYVALEVLRRVPDRVTRLALLDTVARAESPEQSANRERLIALARLDGLRAVHDALWPLEVTPARVDDPELSERFWRMLQRFGPAAFERQQRAIMARRDSRPDLPRVAAPTLVLCGRDDRITPLPESEATAAAVPGARLVVLDDCGHLSPWERPEAVTAALREWLEV
jgi:pimeloyl-ACP methyl ester carboxylesterase